jgi:RNA polymerase sigma-70 factor (ECF subfamily)
LVDEQELDEQNPMMPAIFVDWSQAPETLFASAEAQAELEQCVIQLPERLRSTFLLRESEGLSTAETAEVLGINPGAVKVQLHRARLQLRECLATYFGERLATAQEK